MDFVVKKASTSCIVIALVAIVRQDIFGLGLFYYLLKILAMIKIFFTPVSKESSPGYVITKLISKNLNGIINNS